MVKRLCAVYLSPEQLAICRANPAAALTIVGPDALPCLLCGVCLKRLDGHLARAHGLESKAAYQEECEKKWGETWPLGAKVEVVCQAMQKKVRERASAWYWEHQAQVLSEHRAEYKTRRQYVTKEAERADILMDPRRAMGQNHVDCVECWQRAPEALNNAHLKQHDLTTAAYKAKDIRADIDRFTARK